MNLGEIDEFVNKLKLEGINLPKDVVFICNDFEDCVPDNMHSQILVEAGGSNIISEKVFNNFIKEKAKL